MSGFSWGMTPNLLFTQALQLEGTPWEVVDCRFEGSPQRLELALDFKRGTRFECPDCSQSCPVHDTVDKKWRHINFFQFVCELQARTPRIRCEKCGTKLITVPWSRAQSGFTLMMEAFVMMLAQQMPMRAVARIVGERDTRLWRVLAHYVEKAYAKEDWSQIQEIAIDETSARKGHRYVTVVLDVRTRRLLFMGLGKDHETLGEFQRELGQHRAQRDQIKVAAIDMSGAYRKGLRKFFPKAQWVYDRFHIMQLAGKAVDEVRKILQSQGADLKGSMWLFRGNEWNLSPSNWSKRKGLAKQYKEMGRALSLRDALQDLFELDQSEALAGFKQWRHWAACSRLEPFRNLGQTLKEHWDGIVWKPAGSALKLIVNIRFG